ncbi:hypothetical protein CsSME_00031560 [Camellia sinensis var. sinensis]
MASDEFPIPEPTIGIGAALGVDMEVEEAAALLSLAERPFDAATYRPHTHMPPPGGILRFEGFIPRLDKDTLLHNPIEHISADASTVISRRIDDYGSIFEVRTLVDDVGFGHFCFGLIQMRVESWLYGASVERWWDTTSSFHFSPTGEMTLIPYDFSMLFGLRVRGSDLVLFDLYTIQWRYAQLQLLGAIPGTTGHGIVLYGWFLEQFFGTQSATVDEVAQYTRGFLIYLLGTTLFANRENTVGLYILEALVHLPRVADYNWGGAGLATLYYYMSFVFHLKEDSLGGYWRVWEVYTYFTSLALVPVRPIELSFEQHCLVDRTFLYFSRFFDTITADQGVVDPDISHPPLAGIRVVDDLQDGPELDLLMIGEDGDNHHELGGFAIFLHIRVMAPFTPGVARAVLEVAAAPVVGVGDALIRDTPAVAPNPGLPVLPTEIVYMRPDRVIKQISLEPIEERDRRLVFALGVEQIPRAYGDELLRMINRLLIMLELAPKVLAGPSAANRQRPDLVRGRGGTN